MALVHGVRPMILLSVALLVAVWPAATQHATYRFAAEHGNLDSLVAFLRWTHVEEGDVYLATKFFTGCGIGKLGGQIHADGTHVLLLSLWDHDGVAYSARGRSPQCSRFSQGVGHVWPAGTGAHCVVPYRFRVGTEYRFELTKAADTSGALWTLGVSDGNSATNVGSIYVSSGGAGGDCSVLEPEAESSMEYYRGGQFRTEAAWRGPFFGGEEGLTPADVDVDCGPGAAPGAAGAPANVSSTTRGGAQGRPGLLFRRGRGVVQGCERRSLWRHGDEPASGGVAGGRPAALNPSGAVDSPIALWVAAGSLAVVGAAAVAFTTWQRYCKPGMLALEDRKDGFYNSDPKQIVALLGTGDSDAASDLSRAGSVHTNPPGSELC